jgi:hypothetical protein
VGEAAVEVVGAGAVAAGAKPDGGPLVLVPGVAAFVPALPVWAAGELAVVPWLLDPEVVEPDEPEVLEPEAPEPEGLEPEALEPGALEPEGLEEPEPEEPEPVDPEDDEPADPEDDEPADPEGEVKGDPVSVEPGPELPEPDPLAPDPPDPAPAGPEPPDLRAGPRPEPRLGVRYRGRAGGGVAGAVACSRRWCPGLRNVSGRDGSVREPVLLRVRLGAVACRAPWPSPAPRGTAASGTGWAGSAA